MEQEETSSEECDIGPSMARSVNAVCSEYSDQTPNPSISESNLETILDKLMDLQCVMALVGMAKGNGGKIQSY